MPHRFICNGAVSESVVIELCRGYILGVWGLFGMCNYCNFIILIFF